MWTVLTIVLLRHVNCVRHCVPETCELCWSLCSWDMWTVLTIVFLRHVNCVGHCVPETCRQCQLLCSCDLWIVFIIVFMRLWTVLIIVFLRHRWTVVIIVFLRHVNSVDHCVHHCVPMHITHACVCVWGGGGRVFSQTLPFTPYHPHGSRAWQCGIVPVFWRSCERVCPSPQQSSAILCRKTQTMSLHMGWQRSPLWVYSAHKHSNKNTEQKTGDKCNCGNNIQTCSLRCNTVVRCFFFTVHCGQ